MTIKFNGKNYRVEKTGAATGQNGLDYVNTHDFIDEYACFASSLPRLQHTLRMSEYTYDL